jgi:hypothetical protein
LVVRQITGEYKCESVILAPYLIAAQQLLQQFTECSIQHIPREENADANRMAQNASRYRINPGDNEKLGEITSRSLLSVLNRNLGTDMFYLELDENDWRAPIVSYLRNPNGCNDNTLKLKARKYVLMGKPEDVLYKRGAEGLLLKCVSKYESLQVLAEVHEGICGAHQSRVKMRWLIHRYGYFWPSVLKDCIEYAEGCESSQRHGPIPRIPATELSLIIKPWPFRGWAVDLIGKVKPTSKKKNSFVIVATDYFTKWVEAKAYKNVTEYEVIQFYKDMIIHRFGLPQTITIDNGLPLNGSRVLAFAQDHGIKICNSTR